MNGAHDRTRQSKGSLEYGISQRLPCGGRDDQRAPATSSSSLGQLPAVWHHNLQTETKRRDEDESIQRSTEERSSLPMVAGA